ncbi:hypothetical protein BX616_010914 [Lobosporangium transversale]|nr:hypothetical protein BX616_010914 [Lobosporangium transversale]
MSLVDLNTHSTFEEHQNRSVQPTLDTTMLLCKSSYPTDTNTNITAGNDSPAAATTTATTITMPAVAVPSTKSLHFNPSGQPCNYTHIASQKDILNPLASLSSLSHSPATSLPPVYSFYIDNNNNNNNNSMNKNMSESNNSDNWSYARANSNGKDANCNGKDTKTSRTRTVSICIPLSVPRITTKTVKTEGSKSHHLPPLNLSLTLDKLKELKELRGRRRSVHVNSKLSWPISDRDNNKHEAILSLPRRRRHSSYHHHNHCLQADSYPRNLAQVQEEQESPSTAVEDPSKESLSTQFFYNGESNSNNSSNNNNMNYRDSINSMSTCVNSPTRTSLLPLTAELYSKCQGLASLKGTSIINKNNTCFLPHGEQEGDIGGAEEETMSDFDEDLDLYLYGDQYDDDDEQSISQDEQSNFFTFSETAMVASTDEDGQDLESIMEDEIEVMPWVQEAIQTVSALEARLIELEEDCQSIPLYEQDRIQMIRVIQDLDATVQKDRAWIDNAETAIRWTSFALEEALLASSTRRPSHSDNMYKQPSVAMSPHFDHDSELSPVQAYRQASGRFTVDNEGPQLIQRRYQHTMETGSRSQRQDALEIVYRNAMLTALRHLKTVENSQEPGREATDMEVDRRVAQELDAPNAALQEWLDNTSLVSPISQRIQRQDDEPNMALSKAEENSRDTLSNNGDGDDEARCPTIYSDTTRVEDKQDSSLTVPNMQPATEFMTGSNPLSHPKSHLAFTTTATDKVHDHSISVASFQATLSGTPQPLEADVAGGFMDECVFLKQHIQALDRLRLQELTRHQRAEQVHQQLIADLTRFSNELLLSVSDLTCAQAALDEASEIAMITLKSMESTSASEQQGSGNDCSLPSNASKRKRLIATSCKGLSESMGMVAQGIKRMRTLAADCVGIMELAQVQSATAQPASISNNEETRLSKEGDGEEDKPEVATGAATTTVPPTDSATATETAMQAALPPSLSPLVIRPNLLKTEASISSMSPQTKTPPTPTAMALSLPVTAIEQRPPSVFVDNVAFQEFESHLALFRVNSESIPKRISFGLGFGRRKSTQKPLSSHDVTGNPITNTNPSGMQSVTGAVPHQQQQFSHNMQSSPFMKRVLEEDIYPCLLVHPRPATIAKQGSWINSWLQSGTPSPSSSVPAHSLLSPKSYETNSQTSWFQQLLTAMERNECEIEFWKKNTHRRTSIQEVPPQQQDQDHDSTTPPNVPCCLCGIKRSCEFRLRIVNPQGDFSAGSSTEPPHLSCPSVSSTLSSPPCYSLDRFCRDRIVAVCDFYMFMTHLRQGLLDHQSNLELFRRVLCLRQRMGCARIGFMDIVHTPNAAQLPPIVVHSR